MMEINLTQLIKTAGQASIYLRENIVQCKQTNQDTYSKLLIQIFKLKHEVLLSSRLL